MKLRDYATGSGVTCGNPLVSKLIRAVRTVGSCEYDHGSLGTIDTLRARSQARSELDTVIAEIARVLEK